MSLFNYGKFRLHSGSSSCFKIECGFLSNDDWQTIVNLIAQNLDFKEVIGIPSGGLKLAEALKFYKKVNDASLPTLIIDDVLTTGRSMEKERNRIGGYCIGVVLFARDKCPPWIYPIFSMNSNFKTGWKGKR